jgi:PTH1 family peptidyl-tRNA hydrolase
MNESGRAVGEAARFLKLATSDVVVLHDEIDLLPGKLKVKVGGGNAGHNGLRSITAHLDNEYMRVRIGVGHPGSKELVHTWVLHDFARADREWLEPLLEAVAEAAARLAVGDHVRFLTDVARTLGERDDKVRPAGKGKTAKAAGPAGDDTPKSSDVKPDTGGADRPAKSPGSHPAGERAGKRATALAENLKNWLAARRQKD